MTVLITAKLVMNGWMMADDCKVSPVESSCAEGFDNEAKIEVGMDLYESMEWLLYSGSTFYLKCGKDSVK